MKESERKQKFSEFTRLHQEGQLCSSEIANKLGISKNTHYNWRKKLRGEVTGNKSTRSQPSAALPSFTKIVPQTRAISSVSCHIEITVGSTIVIRIPDTLQPQTLQQIFAMISSWGQ